ncbi:MAG TPA: protein phosphatase 2C domain-containing protein [Geobacteraceae bacterium]
MRASWISDIGKIRENNEDTVFADTENGVFLLADGMGGASGGEIASSLAVRTAYDYLRGRLPRADRASVPRLLADTLASAHAALFKRSLAEPELSGMGTTLEIMAVRGEEAFICHVGDSRVYLMRDGELRQLTTDDNMASLLVKQEHLSPEAVPPQARHILTQAVGASESLVPEIRAIGMRHDDIIMICSDGLTGMLADREIADIIGTCRHDLDKTAAALVQRANTRGGFDNISLILVEPAPLA